MAISGAEGFAEILSATSFRAKRDGSGNQGILSIAGVPSGSYRITATTVAYDGDSPPAGFRFRVIDDFAERFSQATAGAVDTTVSITSGTMRFMTLANSGFRLNDFFIEAAA